jgi:Tfp pilus assembly protein PilO
VKRAGALGVLALLLVSALWWTVVAGPARQDLDDARDELASAEADAATLSAEAPAVTDDSPTAAEIEAELAQLAVAVPAEVDLAGMLRLVGQLAEADGMALVTVVPGRPEPSGTGPASVPVELQLQGPLDGLVRFLAALRSEPRVVVVERLLVTPLDPTTSDPTLDVTLGLRAFSTSTTAAPGGAPTVTDDGATDDLAVGEG